MALLKNFFTRRDSPFPVQAQAQAQAQVQVQVQVTRPILAILGRLTCFPFP